MNDSYDALNKPFSLDQVAKYDAWQAEMMRGILIRIRDAVPGGHDCDLDGLVGIIHRLASVAKSEGR